MTDVEVTTLKDLIDICYKGDSKKVMEVFISNLKEFEQSRIANDVKNMQSCLVIAGIAGDALINSHGIKEKILADILYNETNIFENNEAEKTSKVSIYLDETDVSILVSLLKKILASEGSKKTDILIAEDFWTLSDITENIGKQVWNGYPKIN